MFEFQPNSKLFILLKSLSDIILWIRKTDISQKWNLKYYESAFDFIFQKQNILFCTFSSQSTTAVFTIPQMFVNISLNKDKLSNILQNPNGLIVMAIILIGFGRSFLSNIWFWLEFFYYYQTPFHNRYWYSINTDAV